MARRSRVTGGGNVKRLLRRLDDNATAAVKKEVADFGEATRWDAVKVARGVSNTLARNIEVRKSRDGLTVRVGVITKKARREAYYARWVEFGTKPHSLAKGARIGDANHRARAGSGGGGWHPGVPARPYLIPAFKLNKAHYRPRINRAISRAIRATANGR